MKKENVEKATLADRILFSLLAFVFGVVFALSALKLIPWSEIICRGSSAVIAGVCISLSVQSALGKIHSTNKKEVPDHYVGDGNS